MDQLKGRRIQSMIHLKHDSSKEWFIQEWFIQE